MLELVGKDFKVTMTNASKNLIFLNASKNLIKEEIK